MTKNIFITGGTKGIGFACAKQLAKLGHRVGVSSRSLSSEKRALCREYGLELFELEVTDVNSVANCFDPIIQSWQQIDVLVNNAGVGVFAPFEEISSNNIENMITTNLTGALYCTQKIWPLMRQQGFGRVINIGSIANDYALKGNVVYGASKHGLAGMTRTLTEEGKDRGVFATLVSLGAVYTEIWHGREGFDKSEMLDLDATARMITQIIEAPYNMRIDEIKIYPPKGAL